MSTGYSRSSPSARSIFPKVLDRTCTAPWNPKSAPSSVAAAGVLCPQAIEKQLSELVTSHSKPRSAYKDLIEKTDALQSELEGLSTRRHELAKTLDDLEEAQDTLVRLSTGDRDQADQTDLTDVRKRHRQLTELEVRIAAAGSDLELRTRNLGQVNTTQTERAELKETSSAEERAVEQAGQRLENVRHRKRTAGRNLMACAPVCVKPRRKSLKLTGSCHSSVAHWPAWNGRRGFAN